MYKKIISLFLVIATVCGVLVVPASATEALPPAGSGSGGSSGSVGLGLNIVDFVDWSLEEATYNLKLIGSIFIDELCPEREGSNFSHSFIVDTVMVDGVLGDYYVCQYCGRNSGYMADANGLNSAYNQYVSSLQTDLGSSVVGSNGFYLYANAIAFSQTGGPSNYGLGKVFTYGPWSPTSSTSASITYEALNAPVSGYYTYFRDYSMTEGVSFKDEFKFAMDGGSTSAIRYRTRTAVNAGSVLIDHYKYLRLYTPSGQFNTIRFSHGWYVEPLSGNMSDFTSLNVFVDSRPASIIGDYGIIGDDGSIIHVEGNMIVDESTNTVYNPVTNTTNNYTDYAFDYSDRSYNLTLEDGSTIKVVYGNENITIQEGDTIYNVYYLIPDDSGSGGGSDSGDTPSGEDMSWWKQAWTNFTDKLFSILGNGGSSVNPDTAPAVPDDEETGEKGYSVIDLFVVLKDGTWAFITGIVSTAYDGFTGFVESVSSAGSFFTFYDEESEDGILFVPLEGGETIWD